MNYLVTGGRGFIGSHIVRRLIHEGHRVVCYAHNTDTTSMNEIMSPEEIVQVKIVCGQINDMQLIMQTIIDEHIEVIIHEAAVLGAVGEVLPRRAVEVNILGTMTIFEAARLTGIKRVVWASSQSIFGMPEYYEKLIGPGLIPNDAPLNPSLVYGGTKMFCEFIANWYYEKYGLETIGLRYTMVFGLGRQRGAGQYATELINNPALGIPGVVENGDTAPCWIYVEDAARATVMASQCSNTKSRVFTLGLDIVPIKDIRDYILTLLPDADIRLLPGYFPAAYNLDCSQAEKEFGFKCEYSVFDGVHETINIIRAKRGLEPV